MRVTLDPRTDSWLAYPAVAVAAFVLVSLTVIEPIELAMAVAGTGVLLATRWFAPWGASSATRMIGLALGAAAFLLVMSLAAWSSGPEVAKTALYLAIPALVVGGLSAAKGAGIPGWRWIAALALVAMVLIVAAVWVVAAEDPDIDVLGLHEAAADALVDGDNPYADLAVADTSHLAPEGAEWTAYPYPPLALAAYAGADLLLGDARWAGVIALVTLILMMTRPWAAVEAATAAAAVALALALVTQPILGHILSQGWTDVLALPLLAGAGLLWRRNPVASAVLLGLAFGTKQYFVVAFPLLLLWGDEDRWRRTLIAGGTAALSLLPAFLLDPGAAWHALVTQVLDAPVRADSVGFAGLGWEAPLWLMGLVVLAAAVWMAWGNGGSSRFLLAMGAVLGAGFLFGSQAFLNYWFMLASLAVVALASHDTDPVIAPA